MDKNRAMIFYRTHNQLSAIGSRMCRDDAFMMLKETVLSPQQSDDERACEFKSFYVLPFPQVLEVVKSNRIEFKMFGIL